MSHLSSTPLIARIFLLAGVLLGILALLSLSRFSAYAQGIEMDEIEYPEKGTHTVAAYTAMDPEGEDITWSLSDAVDDGHGPDYGDFTIEGGVLMFKDTPDYENPADDGDDNIYNVTVVAADSDTGGMMRTVTVTVTVTNVDEDGEAILSTLQPLEGIPLTATLTDPDGEIAKLTWEWERSQDGSTGWTNIATTTIDDDTITTTTTIVDGTTTTTTTTETTVGETTATTTTTITTIVEGTTTTTTTPPIETDIATTVAGTATYRPVGDDVGSYLRATANYTDGHSPDPDPEDPDKTAQVVSANKALKNLENDAPVFTYAEGDVIPDDIANAGKDVGDEIPVGTALQRKVEENSETDTPVGAPVAAYDEDGDLLTYTLGGTNAILFTIDRTTGQIRVGKDTTFNASTDTEISGGNNAATYSVDVTATDPSGLDDTITVTINVTDVDEDPSITPGDTSIAHDENEPITVVLATYSATDPEDRDAAELEWSLSGADRDRFNIGNANSDRGQLTFKSSPDYESPADSGRNNVYNATVIVTDSDGDTDSSEVTVAIRNMMETGAVVLLFDSVRPDTLMRRPEVGTRIMAKLTDDDNPSRSSVSWQWQKNTDNIAGATSATYTPVADDENALLRAIATYTDGFGSDTAQFVLNLGVQLDAPNNQSPVFANGSPVFEVAENSVQDSDVPLQAAAEATDDDDTTLSYTLGGRDAGVFTIDYEDGLISVRGGTDLDHEAKPSYSVTVTATDPSADSTTVTVTIKVTNVEEPPSIADGGSTIEYLEIKNSRPNTDPVFTYTATDPENDNANPRLPFNWSLSGTDVALFEIDTVRGVLTFKSPPDHEAAADIGSDNVYNVTVIVDDSEDDGDTTDDDTREVTVTVTNVDELGEVTLPTLQPLERVEMEATLADPDTITPGSIEWQWARSTNRSSWTDIEEATNATHTPGKEDVGSYLRATASYTDGHSPTDPAPEDPDKTASLVSANKVLKNLENDAPVFNHSEGNTYTNDAGVIQDSPDVTVGVAIPDALRLVREVDENSQLDTPVGDPVAAYDDDEDVLTYTLSGTDDDDEFTIDRRTGQIKVGAATPLNFEVETEKQYTVTVTATDPSGNVVPPSSTGVDVSITVTINVTDVDEDPSINDAATIKTTLTEITDAPSRPSTTITRDGIEDNTPLTPADGAVTLAIYEATDDDDENTTLTWSLSGADSDKFSISNEGTPGQLTFKGSLDFESPTDSGKNNVYNVTVVVTDSDDDTDSQEVTVEVINMEEAGVVTLSNLRPEDGVPIRATLTDPDGGITGLTWQWADDGTTTFTDIEGETSATYTPTTPNVTHDIRATATYTDNAMNPEDDPSTEDMDESMDTASSASADDAHDVQAHDDANEPPEFPDQDDIALGRQTDQTREVPENSAAATSVGDPVTAADSEGEGPTARTDILTYTLGGPDAALFTIDTIDDTDTDPEKVIGQIRVGAETKLDYETKKTYTVTVTATDPSLATDTITVTIKVVDVDEEPVISESGLGITGDANIDYDENGTGAVATYTADGEAAAGATWSLEGADAGDFSLSSRGVLTFRSTPNFEDPTDQGTNNVYNVTVKATSGAIDTTRSVTVTVVNLEEDGSVTLSSAQNEVKVGVAITAEVTDLDVVDPITVTWQWASSSSATGPWDNIADATDEAYTPVEDDVGNYLQATASYTDGHGSGKSESAATTDAVLAITTDVIGDNGVVTLSSDDPVVGEALTASLTDLDVVTPNTVTWQWASSSSATGPWDDIAGATDETYTPGQSDVGNYLQATASYTDAQGSGQSASAATTSAVLTAGTIVDNGDVTLSSNDPVMGEAVTASLADPDNPTGITWQWASSSTASGTYTDITGATTDTYTPVQGDVGNYLRATASYNDAQGSGQSASAATANAVLINSFDSNGDGRIQRTEVIGAIQAFLFGKTATRAEVIKVIHLHLFPQG